MLGSKTFFAKCEFSLNCTTSIDPSKMRKSQKSCFHLCVREIMLAAQESNQSFQICNNLPKVIARENLKNSKNYIFIFTNLINSVGKMHGYNFASKILDFYVYFFLLKNAILIFILYQKVLKVNYKQQTNQEFVQGAKLDFLIHQRD